MIAELIDLSHAVEEGMTTYPGLPGPTITTYLSRQASRDQYTAGTEFHIGQIDMVANAGTYLDAPAHRYADGADVSELALSSLANLPGIAIAVEEEAIGPTALAGLPIEGRAVLFATGWDRYWRTADYGSEEHPFLTGGDAWCDDSPIGGEEPMHGTPVAHLEETRGHE